MDARRIDDRLTEKIQPGVTQLRVIVGALAVGVLMFLSISLAAHAAVDAEPADGFAGVLPWIAIVAAPLAFFGSRMLAAACAQQGRRKLLAGKLELPEGTSGSPAGSLPLAELGDAGKMFCVYQTQTILAGAVREGAAFFCIAVFFITGSWLSLAAAVTLVATLVGLWPSAPAAAEWINDQLRLAENEKLLER